MRVDLPDPDGPMMAVNWPRRRSTRGAAQRVDRRVAAAVAPREVARHDYPVAVALRSQGLGAHVACLAGDSLLFGVQRVVHVRLLKWLFVAADGSHRTRDSDERVRLAQEGTLGAFARRHPCEGTFPVPAGRAPS